MERELDPKFEICFWPILLGDMGAWPNPMVCDIGMVSTMENRLDLLKLRLGDVGLGLGDGNGTTLGIGTYAALVDLRSIFNITG